MGSTDLVPTAVRRAKAAWLPEYLGMIELEKKLARKVLEDPGPGPPSPPPSSGEPSGSAREAMAKNLRAEEGELVDRQDRLEQASAHLAAEVSAAGGGPWEGRLDHMEEAMIDRTRWRID